MKKYLIKTAAFALPVLFLLIGVNYFGDAAKIFDSTYEAEMAKIVKSGTNVTNISANFNERIFQRELIKTIKFQPDVVVIGSSRTFLINNDYFANKKFFNSSVSGAGIEDIIAVYQLYKQNKIVPRKIILNIDPWLFNDNSKDSRWQSISEAYYAFLRDHKMQVQDKATIFDSKYYQLFSPSYFQSSVKKIPGMVKNADKPLPTAERYNATNTHLADGSFTYNKAYREKSVEKTESEARKYVAGKVYRIEQFDSLSTQILNVFYTLVEDMRANNIEVEFFLAPYHPAVYSVVSAKYPQVLATENFVKEYARKKGLNVVGSFDPQFTHMDRSYFYDGMHCKESGIKLLLAKDLLAQNN